MPGRHTERAFEDAVEQGLLRRGWAKGDPRTFDPKRGLTPSDFLAFFDATQPQLRSNLEKQHGAATLPGALVDGLCKALDSRGALDVVRHGFKFYGKQIDCA